MRDALLAIVPDTVQSFELRCLLLEEDTQIRGDLAAAVVWNDRWRLVMPHGAPEPAMVDEVLAGKPAGQMWRVFAGADRPSYGARWAWETASFFGPGDPAPLEYLRSIATPDVRPMTAEDIRRDVPPQAAPILLDALTRGSVIGGWAKGELVAFAFSLLRSERYFHPSLVSFGSFAGGSMARRIARVVAALVAEETATGRLPAMAIADSNVAAIKGCTMMGFEPLGKRWVATLR